MAKDLKENYEKDIEDDVIIECKNLYDKDFQNRDVSDVTIENSHIEKTKFDYTKIKRLKLVDVFIGKCTLSNSVWNDGYIYKVGISDSKCVGMHVCKSRLKKVIVENTKLSLSLFDETELKDIEFRNCVLEEASFYGAKLENVIFRNCDLKDVDFSQTKFQHVDIRGSQLKNTKIEEKQFRELIIDMSQAPYIAHIAGASIEDDVIR